jgi:hypothetical protein
LYNRPWREGTHTALYLGKKEGSLMFGEQFGKMQREISYKEMRKKGLSARQIIAPAN